MDKYQTKCPLDIIEYSGSYMLKKVRVNPKLTFTRGSVPTIYTIPAGSILTVNRMIRKPFWVYTDSSYCYIKSVGKFDTHLSHEVDVTWLFDSEGKALDTYLQPLN